MQVPWNRQRGQQKGKNRWATVWTAWPHTLMPLTFFVCSDLQLLLLDTGKALSLKKVSWTHVILAKLKLPAMRFWAVKCFILPHSFQCIITECQETSTMYDQNFFLASSGIPWRLDDLYILFWNLPLMYDPPLMWVDPSLFCRRHICLRNLHTPRSW